MFDALSRLLSPGRRQPSKKKKSERQKSETLKSTHRRRKIKELDGKCRYTSSTSKKRERWPFLSAAFSSDIMSTIRLFRTIMVINRIRHMSTHIYRPRAIRENFVPSYFLAFARSWEKTFLLIL